ncbi:MAG: branched-chain amino acid ABC transporter ATP-binding protein/permease [Candidatus Microbacterium stercoravium]
MIGSYFADAATQVLFLVMLAISLNLLLGLAGQLSMATSAFYGIGAYTCAALTATGITLTGEPAAGPGLPFVLGLLGAVILTAIAGFLVALPAGRRVKGDYLILLTLAFFFLFTTIASNWIPVTGGPNGAIVVPIDLFGWSPATTEEALIFFALLTVALGLVCGWIASSPFGRLLRGIRDDEVAVQSLGKGTIWPKMLVFAVTAGIAGGVGALSAGYSQYVAPGTYSLDLAILVAACVALGGPGNVLGSAFAAVVIGSLRPVLENIPGLGDNAIPWQAVIYGVVLVLTIRFRPQGILPEGIWSRIWSRMRNAHRTDQSDDHAREDAPVALPPARAISVEVHGISKQFGGLSAARDVDLRLRPGEIVALIGPNGAGKTTVFNLITGSIRPDAGRVSIDGVDVTGWSPKKIARAGMVRYFQNVRVFEGLTAIENVSMAVPDQPGESLARTLFRPLTTRNRGRDVRREAMEALMLVGASHLAHKNVRDLAFGEQKLVAFARLIATGADVLLLDEPTSGVDPRSAEQIIELVKRLAEAGKTICIVEHSLHVVTALADRVVFMDAGKVIAEGTVSEITNQPELVDLYFGT